MFVARYTFSKCGDIGIQLEALDDTFLTLIGLNVFANLVLIFRMLRESLWWRPPLAEISAIAILNLAHSVTCIIAFAHHGRQFNGFSDQLPGVS